MSEKKFIRDPEPLPGSPYTDFLSRADAFVSACMADYRTQPFTHNKVIHDCVWGTVMFYPWELRIIDSPLLQRLRRINQVGLAVLTYPSAHHSRFEHTLGVVAVTSQMVSGIQQNAGGSVIPQDHVHLLRLAALLHDVGHCFFSHLSESIYGQTKEFEALYASEPIFAGAAPHEILGYIIINTPSFRRFFASQTDYPFAGRDPDDILRLCGRMIVGAYPKAEDGVRYDYLTEMINGQFDADSLDYLRRDSYATGLALTYHIDRFLYKLRIAEKSGDGITEKHMTVPVSGITTVEEMVFSKLMLTRYIYQHQKVLAVESMMTDIVDGMRRGGRLLHPCDFLFFCDDDIHSIGSGQRDRAMRPAIADWPLSADTSRTVGDEAARIMQRDLPKKALVLNLGNISSINGKPAGQLTAPDIYGTLKNIPDLRREIFAETQLVAAAAGLREPEIYDIRVCIPRINMSKDFSKTPVLTYDGNFIPMSEAIDLDSWTRPFAGNSYNAYVFSDVDVLPAAGVAALRVLRRHGVECVRSKIFSGLKASDALEEIIKITGE